MGGAGTDLQRLIRPSSVARFFDRLPRFDRDSRNFRRKLWRYVDAFETGGRRTVTALTFTHDASFTMLGVLATLATGGAAAGGAAIATETAAATLVRGAATSFVVTQIDHSAQRLGRVLAGETVTTAETTNDLFSTAVSSLSDAALSEVVGQFMSPLTDIASAEVERQLARGNLLRGVAGELTSSQLQSVVEDAIRTFIEVRANDMRSILRGLNADANERRAAEHVSRELMRNRAFRQHLERHLQQDSCSA